MVIVYWLYFHRMFVKIGMGECGDRECLSKVFVEEDVAIANVACIEQVKAGLL